VVRLRYLDASSDSFGVIQQALAARGAQTLKLTERERPFAPREFGLKRAGATRKKLRQDWNRLCSLGAVEVLNDRSQAAVEDAFASYLVMEAASWKGEQGTALLCDDDDTLFTRRLMSELAASGSASVALLKVDG